MCIYLPMVFYQQSTFPQSKNRVTIAGCYYLVNSSFSSLIISICYHVIYLLSTILELKTPV